MSDLSALVSTYWRYQALSRGDRRQRLESADLFWAVDEVSEAVMENQDEVLTLLDALISAPNADACYLGCGPIEDLLSQDGPRWERAVAERCETSAAWAEAVSCVWLDDQAEALVPMLAPYRPARPIEPQPQKAQRPKKKIRQAKHRP